MPRRLAFAFAAILAGFTLGTGVAQATPAEDYAYIRTLDQFGIYYSSEPAAIAAGESVCDALDAGLTVDEIGGIAVNEGVGARDAYIIIGAAIGSYCDEHSHLIEGRGETEPTLKRAA